MSNGENVYVAYRNHKEIYRQTAGWALDYATILKIKREVVKWVAVWVHDKGYMAIAPFAFYEDKTRLLKIDYTVRGGADQRVLPLSEFRWNYPPTFIR